MPGTLVHDSAVPALVASATFTATTNGTWTNVGKSNLNRVRLQVSGVVSGTTPTLDVTIQSADDGSGTNSVTLARFSQVTATLAAVSKFVDIDNQKPYVRAVLTITGTTPSFAGVAVTLEEDRYLRTETDSA